MRLSVFVWQIPLATRIIGYQRSAQIKFVVRTIFYLVLVIMLTYVATEDFSEMWRPIDSVITFWVMTMVMDEISQLVESGFFEWISSFWNKLDLCMYTLFLCHLVLRSMCSDGQAHGCMFDANQKSESVAKTTGGFEYQELSKPMYALSVGIFWIRILQKLAISQKIGSLLYIFGRMAGDLVNFMVMLFVFFGAFSVIFVGFLFIRSSLL